MSKKKERTIKQLNELLTYRVALAGGIKPMTFDDEDKLCAVIVQDALDIKAELDAKDETGLVVVGKKTYRLRGVADTGTCFFAEDIAYVPSAVKPAWLEEDKPF